LTTTTIDKGKAVPSSGPRRWAVAKRLDWPGAKRPFFLFGGPGGLYTYHRPSGGAVFFKTQESAQYWADRMNAENYAHTA
jgi:hypothetical protein